MLKKFKGVLVAVPASMTLLAASAHAAVPAEVTTAIGDMKSDGLTVAGAVLAGVIAIWAVKRIRSAL